MNQCLQSLCLLNRTVFVRSAVQKTRLTATKFSSKVNVNWNGSRRNKHFACSGSTVMESHTADTDVYSKVFTHQSTNVEAFHDIFRQCIESLKPRTGEVLTIGDYGAAQGARSLKLFQESVSYMRRRHGSAHPIVIIYNDLPGNDFSGLFQKMEGLPDGIKPFRDSGENVFVLANGRSMYEQVMPPASMDIIFCSFALMFLSRRPCHIQNGLTEEKGTEDERRQWKEQAEKDWENFLIHRAAELKSGGYLIVASILSHPVIKLELTNLWTVAFDSLVTEGIISQEECRMCTFPCYYRTVEEYRLPFDSEISKVRQLKLKLLSVGVEKISYLSYTEENEDRYPRQQFETDFVTGSLSIIHQSIVSGLSNNRTREEKKMVIDLFEQKLLDHLRARGLNSLILPRVDIVMRKL